jgi:hypothetical protein
VRRDLRRERVARFAFGRLLDDATANDEVDIRLGVIVVIVVIVVIACADAEHVIELALACVLLLPGEVRVAPRVDALPHDR